MFNFNAKLFKKIEDEKNNHMQMFQELKEALDAIKKDFNIFDEKISKFKATDYVKSPEIVNIIRSEIFEAAKRLPKIRDTSVNKPVPTGNTDEYKNLPTFLTCLEFAKVLNITGDQFWSRKKQIDKRIRCYNFGKITYRYYKTDVLRFIRHKNTEDDIFILLKNSKDDRISRKDLISLLSVSYAQFHMNKKRIEKIIPPIEVSKKLIFYKKSDVITFFKGGGLNDH